MSFPLPDTYAVAQLDSEGTFLGLDPDLDALEAAHSLQPKKYIVYLQHVRSHFISRCYQIVDAPRSVESSHSHRAATSNTPSTSLGQVFIRTIQRNT